ncbi:hypothetical protein [Methylomonas methanica]|uniref:hypothetical protein n=1 Tax=Methylomonas methanica TaxID=421 RepID=UPI0011D24628|nr:hypothetical protein [Methylomonas methanica]
MDALGARSASARMVRVSRPPHVAFILRAEGFERGFPKGLPSPYEKRDASLHRPCGLIRSKPPVLGAASGDFLSASRETVWPLATLFCRRYRSVFFSGSHALPGNPQLVRAAVDFAARRT